MRAILLALAGVFMLAAIPAAAKPSEEKATESDFSITCQKIVTPTQDGFDVTAQCQHQEMTLALLGNAKSADLSADVTLRSLTVTREGKAPQTLAVQGVIWMDGFEHALQLMDINFDRQPDIQIWTLTTAGANRGYDYVLFDPTTGYDRIVAGGDRLSGTDIVPDAATKTIAVTGRSSCCMVTTDTYRWSNKELTLLSRMEQGVVTVYEPRLHIMSADFCGRVTRHFNDEAALARIEVNAEACEQGEGPKGASFASFLKELKEQENEMKAEENPAFTLQAKGAKHITLTLTPPLVQETDQEGDEEGDE